MKMAVKVGFSLEESEQLRRIVGKKKISEMPKWKKKIQEKISKNNLPENVGNVLWKVAEDSANYSFNKSHSISYAILAAWTTYLKFKHPKEFFLSLLKMTHFEPNPQDEITKNDLSSNDFQEIFLDNMINGLFDLKSLGSSFEGSNSLMYLINGSVKGIDGYIKRLIDEIRGTLKKNDLKASRTKIALSWTLDQHAMRGDKIEMLQNLTSKLRDYIGDVEAYEDPDFNLFHSDKTTIIVACSQSDFKNIENTKKDSNLIIVKANPLCETIQ